MMNSIGYVVGYVVHECHDFINIAWDMIDNNSEDMNDNESNISLNISEINSDIEN